MNRNTTTSDGARIPRRFTSAKTLETPALRSSTTMKLRPMVGLKRRLACCFIGVEEKATRRAFEAEPRTAARRTNRVVVCPSNPPLLIHVLEGVTEQAIDARLQLSHHPGGRNNPINVEPIRAPQVSRTHQGGCRNHPILVEEIAEQHTDPLVRLSQQGSDPKQPVSVEQYDDDVQLQLAISESLQRQGLPDIIELDSFEGFTQSTVVDPKGKKPVRPSKRSFPDGLTTEEVGESSSASPSEPEAYCTICMEAKFLFECFFMKGCSHMYCASCVSQYVVAKIQENVTSIRCPDPGCKDGFLDPEMCRMILPLDVFDRWGVALCEAVIVGSTKFYCPYKNCSALLIDEGGDNGVAITDSVCPHCNQVFCAQCKVPWHLGFKCKEYRKLGADEREREDLMLMQVAKKCLWQRCPKCKYYVERVDGCMFMKCRCGYQFCYGCAAHMKKDHYCVNCKR